MIHEITISTDSVSFTCSIFLNDYEHPKIMLSGHFLFRQFLIKISFHIYTITTLIQQKESLMKNCGSIVCMNTDPIFRNHCRTPAPPAGWIFCFPQSPPDRNRSNCSLRCHACPFQNAHLFLGNTHSVNILYIYGTSSFHANKKIKFCK